MKATILNRKWLFLLFFPLLLLPACEEDPELPNGTKPEILIGRWKGKPREFNLKFHGICYDIYEFTPTKAHITEQQYQQNREGRYQYVENVVWDYYDWSYDGSSIHQAYKNTKTKGIRSKSVQQITTDSIVINGRTFYRIDEDRDFIFPGGTKPEFLLGKWQSDTIQVSREEYYCNVYEITPKELNFTVNHFRKTPEMKEFQAIGTENNTYRDWIVVNYEYYDRLYRLEEEEDGIFIAWTELIKDSLDEICLGRKYYRIK